MTCELCGRGQAADLLGSPFTFCPACSLYVCSDCWDPRAAACERCARDAGTLALRTGRTAVTMEGAADSAIRAPDGPDHAAAPAPVAVATAEPSTSAGGGLTPPGRVLTTIRPTFHAPSAPTPVAPGSTRLVPVRMEGHGKLASSIRMTIGPRNGEAPTLRVPSLPWRPQVPRPPLEPVPEPRATSLWRMVRGDALGDVGFRLAIGLMLAAGAAFVWVTWPQPAVLPDASPTAVATVEPTAPPPEPSQPASLPATRYTIRSGDTLRSLAVRFYGNDDQWQIIYDANRARIPNPESLTVGQEIVIPPD